MKNIVVPTDFSEYAEAAAAYAILLAQKAGAKLHFIHLLNTPVEWKNLPLDFEERFPETKAQIGHARNALNELVARAEKEGVEAQQSLVYHTGSENLLGHIDDRHPDFIVMGSHGASGLGELIGSNAQRVVRRAKVPVMVVKAPSRAVEFKKIVFTSNFDEQLLSVTDVVTNLAGYFDAEVHMLYVNTPFHFRETSETDRLLAPFLHRAGEKASANVYNALNEERGLAAYISAVDADLVAVAYDGRTALQQLVSPGVNERLVNQSDKPVLCLPAP